MNKQIKDNLKKIKDKRRNILIYFIIPVSAILIILSFVKGTAFFKSPLVYVGTDLIKMDKENVFVATEIEVTNKNVYGITISDLKVETYKDDKTKTGEFLIEGGKIQAGKKKKFSSNFKINLSGVEERNMLVKISGDAGILLFGFIKKEFPIEFLVHTGAITLFESIKSPEIDMNMKLDKIVNSGVLYSGEVIINNKNDFPTSFENLKILMKNDKDEVLGTCDVKGGSVAENMKESILFNGIIPLEALNSGNIKVEVNGDIVILAAGIKKTLPIKAGMNMVIPNIRELLQIKDPIVFNLRGDYDLKGSSVDYSFTFGVKNNGKLFADLKRTKLVISKISRGKEIKIFESKLNDFKIAPENSQSKEFKFTLPYKSIIRNNTKGLFPEVFIVKINTEIAFLGMTQTIPIEIQTELHKK